MILITGAGGSLGGWVARQLAADGADLAGLCRKPPPTPAPDAPKIDWRVGDLRDRASLAAALRGVDRVVHVAGLVDFRAKAFPELLAINVDGVRSLLRACADADVKKVVHVSSVSTIGAVERPGQVFTEDDFGRGRGCDLPYPQSKLRGEAVALEFAAAGLPVVIVNPTFFCGPGDINLKSAHTIVSFLQGQVWVGLTRGGFGYTDVRDVATGVRLALEKGRSGRRYILGGTNILLREFHDLLAKIAGRRPPRIRLHPKPAEWLARAGRIYYRVQGKKPFVDVSDVRMGKQHWFYDYSRAREELGLVCRSPEESLRETIDWLRSTGRA